MRTVAAAFALILAWSVAHDAGAQLRPGSGSGGGSQGFSSVGAIDRTFGEATSQGTGIRIGSEADGIYINIHYNSITGIQMACEVAGVLDDCDKVIKILSGKTFSITDASGNAMFNFDPNGATALLQYALGSLKARKSVWFGAGSLSGDGTQCPALSTDVQINSGPILATFICTDNDSATLYGSVKMPDSWDGGTVTFTHSYIQTAANTGALNGDIAAQCRGNGETPSSTWGTEVAIDDAAVTGSNANDMTTSAAVTPAGTCAAGDMLYFRYQLDATGTTTTIASLHHLGFLMEYAVSSLSD